MFNRFRLLVLLLVSLLFSLSFVSRSLAQPIRIDVDVRQPGRIVPVRQTFPAKPGPFSVYYPRQVAGAHAGVGLLRNVVNLQMAAGDTPLRWRRDSYDPYLFHTTVPDGATSVTLSFVYVPHNDGEGEVEYGVAGSPTIAVVNWGALTFYPKGASVKEVQFAPRLYLPENWRYATALGDGQLVEKSLTFEPVTLERLIDSPVLAGQHLRTVRLDTGTTIPHYLCLAVDDPGQLSLGLSAAFLESMQRLVRESQAMFGARHYRAFRFLVVISQQIPIGGLEHHESTVNVLAPYALGPRGTAGFGSWWFANLVPHEFVHSWNGKYRRPQGLDTADYNSPQSTDLLWVYEGLTEYLGEILMVRAGFRTPNAWREDLRSWAISQGMVPARVWESVGDASTAYSLISREGAGGTMRGSSDFYFEGELHWFEADTIIRRESGGKKSLDDFCRLFFGGEDSAPIVKPYTLADVVTALNTVQPYDWAGFWEKRLNAVGNGFITAGLEGAGWQIVLSDDFPADRVPEAQMSYRYSLGMQIAQNGTVGSVLPNMPAAKAGLRPGMVFAGVNGKKFTPAVLRAAVRASNKPDALPIEILIFDGDTYRILPLGYKEGEKLPVLKRVENKPDFLKEIMTPRTLIPLGPPPPAQ